MAGCFPNPRNKGRCGRCDYSEKRKREFRHGKIGKYLHCQKYGKDCQRVAWNCIALPGGYRKTTYGQYKPAGERDRRTKKMKEKIKDD